MMQKDLPVLEVLPMLCEALEIKGAAVLVAPPGAGKTTAVPLALLGQPWLAGKKIILLQPRRLAARTAARRMASNIGEEVGGCIGYRMRLDTKISDATRIEIVTEGVFQRMISDDPSLDGVGCVIFDEFHERSLDADFGLALALDVRSGLREDLRILVMSATLDCAGVAKLIGDAELIESQGRMYPVDIRYSPPTTHQRIEEAMATAIRKALMEEEGSILAFLPGLAEIKRTHTLLEGKIASNSFVAPLYGAMDIRDQDLAVQPPVKGKRKIVLATALAETSITIDDVRIVIDSGLARVPSYEAALGISSLVTKRASQASITQRAGRAGRTSPGIAIRLWQDAQTASLAAFETPEIMQSDVSSLLLDCMAWGVKGPDDLRFIDQPPPAHLLEARKLLVSLGAIDASGRLTPKGKALSRIGLEPRLASMVMEGKNRKDCLRRAFIALLLNERGLGGVSSDIASRFERAWQDKSARANSLKNVAQRIVSKIEVPEQTDEEKPIGRILCDAFPDRVAKARPGQPGHFIMANGRGVRVDETNPLASADFVVVANIIGTPKTARATALAMIDEKDLLDQFRDEIETSKSYSFDKQSGKLGCRVVRKLGAITLTTSPVPVEPGEDTEAALLSTVQQNGLQILPWSKPVESLRVRLLWLRKTVGASWPDVSNKRLLADLNEWLEPYLVGQTDFNSLAEGGLKNALIGIVPYELQSSINRLAPTHYTVPSGSTVPLDYDEGGEPPTLSVRVQELFGLKNHPSIADGKVPLIVELLSPAHRPIQRTLDLPKFWQGSWADVRADMRGRYPRHEWPVKPADATPTRRAKPRK